MIKILGYGAYERPANQGVKGGLMTTEEILKASIREAEAEPEYIR